MKLQLEAANQKAKEAELNNYEEDTRPMHRNIGAALNITTSIKCNSKVAINSRLLKPSQFSKYAATNQIINIKPDKINELEDRINRNWNNRTLRQKEKTSAQ